MHVGRDADGRIIIGAGDDPGAGDQEGREPGSGVVASELLQFSSPRDPATIAAFLRTRVCRPQSLVWLEGYQVLLRWRAENDISGLYAVPYDVEP